MENKCKIILMDDVHLEGRPSEMCSDFALKVINKIKEIKQQNYIPIIVCAGDIGEGTTGIDWAKQFNCEVVYICGNHEFWGQDYYNEINSIKEKIKEPSYSHIKFLHNESSIIHGIKFIGATLWTDLGSNFNWKEKNLVVRFYSAMGDFKRITAKQWYNDENIQKLRNFLNINGIDNNKIDELILNKGFNPLLEIEENKKSSDFLFQEINKPYEGTSIVVTHHLPSIESWIKKFKITDECLNNDAFNDEKNFLEAAKGNLHSSKDLLMMGFYTNNLKKYFLNSNSPHYWLHGHLHEPIDDLIGKTKIISSPVGYLKQSKEMTLKEIIPDQHSKDLSNYVKNQIENFQWNSEILENIRSFETIISQYEIIISSGLATVSDFNLIANSFLKNHDYAIEKINKKTIDWLSLLFYSANPHLYNKVKDEEIREKTGLNLYLKKQIDRKTKKIYPLSITVNENSFCSEEKLQQINKSNVQTYHYKQWLKELNQAQLNINIYKKTLLDFCIDYEIIK